MSDNPHLKDPEAEKERYLKATGRTRDDPEFRRDWEGVPVWSNVATAYRYNADRNGWTDTQAGWAEGVDLKPGRLVAVKPPPGVNCFAIGIDPAHSSDRYCAVVWGWSSHSPHGIWQVAEWTTPKAAFTMASQWLAVLKLFAKNYKVISITSDSQSTPDDVALHEYGLIIEPAKKGDGSVKARVDRLADLLGTGRAFILKGSALEEDLKVAKFDLEQRALGKYKWDDTVIHPDVADAATYALPAYIESVERAPHAAPPLFDETAWRNAFKPPPAEYGYDAHEDGSSYGGPR
jgi:hypothetical protein